MTPHDAFTYTRNIEEKLGHRPVAELTTGEFEKWLSEQVTKTDDKEKLRKARATANRRFTVLRAILNSAYRKEPARVPSADAWRRVRPFQKVDLSAAAIPVGGGSRGPPGEAAARLAHAGARGALHRVSPRRTLGAQGGRRP